MNLEEILKNSQEPWISYRVRADLFGADPNSPEMDRLCSARSQDPQIRALAEEMKTWPGTVLNSHKSAGQHFHKLRFLADLGLDESDEAIAVALNRMRQNRNPEGLIALPMNISPAHGGTGVPTQAWAICDAPLSLYSLAKMAKNGKAEARQGTEFLVAKMKPFGCPCVVSPELGNFRGPGRKDDPCPFSTLILLELMALYEDLRESLPAHAGTDCLLDLWEHSRQKHPYIFYMGDDFRKLKAPFIWYDLLHVADVLSQFPWTHADPRFRDMMDLIRSKAGPDGWYAPESEWKAWREWEFGKRGQPSRWLTFLILRIEKRLEK